MDRVDVVLGRARRHFQMAAIKGRIVAVPAGHDIATPATTGVEGYGQLIVAGVALVDVYDRVGTLIVVLDIRAGTEVKGLGDRIERYVDAAKGQLRRHCDFRLLDLAGCSQGRNVIGVDRHVGRHIQSHTPGTGHASRVVREQRIVVSTRLVFHVAAVRISRSPNTVCASIPGVGRNEEVLAVPTVEGHQNLGDDGRIRRAELDRQQLAGQGYRIDRDGIIGVVGIPVSGGVGDPRVIAVVVRVKRRGIDARGRGSMA